LYAFFKELLIASSLFCIYALFLASFGLVSKILYNLLNPKDSKMLLITSFSLFTIFFQAEMVSLLSLILSSTSAILSLIGCACPSSQFSNL
jgi:hypothetical protein